MCIYIPGGSDGKESACSAGEVKRSESHSVVSDSFSFLPQLSGPCHVSLSLGWESVFNTF